MNFKTIKQYLLFCIIAGISSLSLANDRSDSILEILAGINHFPDAAQKTALTEIHNHADSSDNEKLILSAIINIQHTVNSDDKKTLKAIIANENSTTEEKLLAKLMLNFAHTLNKKSDQYTQLMAL